MTRHPAASAVVLLLLGSACSDREPVTFATIEEDCKQKCRVAVDACGYPWPDSAAAKQRCVDECIDWKDDSLEQGGGCAASYERMMACVGTLTTCAEFEAWGKRAEDDVCAEESAAFDQACEDF